MLTSHHNIEGKLTLQQVDAQGRLLHEQVTYNSITTAGRQLVTDLFRLNILAKEDQDDKIKRISTIHVGRSNKPFSADQTAMQDPVDVVPIDDVQLLPVNDRIMLRLVGELGVEQGNDALQEAGLFTEDETPIMYNRVTFDTITKSPEFKLKLIWELTF